MNDLITLSDEQKLVREFVRQNPGLTVEQVCDNFDPLKDDMVRRQDIARACGFLFANNLLRLDHSTGALYHVEDVKA